MNSNTKKTWTTPTIEIISQNNLINKNVYNNLEASYNPTGGGGFQGPVTFVTVDDVNKFHVS